MKKNSLFFMYLFMNAVRFGWLLLVGVLVTVVGAIWIDFCVYIGLALLAVYLLICIGSAANAHILMKRLSDDDPEMKELLEKMAEDPKSFVSDAMGNYEEMKQLHAEELLTLSDEDLYEAVYFQNLDIAEAAEDEDKELEQFTGPRRIVYILNRFDVEIQNGGLCQFFVNSSSVVAPYVTEALESVGAQEHRKLFEAFITENRIDVSDLDSFKVFSKRGYIRQTKRFDFDAFDDRYYDLPALQEKIVDYIKENIREF